MHCANMSEIPVNGLQFLIYQRTHQPTLICNDNSTIDHVCTILCMSVTVENQQDLLNNYKLHQLGHVLDVITNIKMTHIGTTTVQHVKLYV